MTLHCYSVLIMQFLAIINHSQYTDITWFIRILGGFLLLIATVPVVAGVDDCPEDETPEKGPHGQICR